MFALNNVTPVKRNAVSFDTSRIDVIGDIHGQRQKLRNLLVAMDYPEKDGSFVSHPDERKLVYTGDYIDRGPYNMDTTEDIQRSVEQGHAKAILGNHEFNAVRWTMRDPFKPGEFLREHTRKNLRQHAGFLEEAKSDLVGYDAAIKWFKTLPVYLICGDYRFVHACWHQQSIDVLHRHECLDDAGRLTDKGWALHPDKDTELLAAVEILLKGPEEKLGNGYGFTDFDGAYRDSARIAWWAENPQIYSEAFCTLPKNVTFGDAPYKPDFSHPLSQEIRHGLHDLPTGTRIFFGHIWLEGPPQPLSDKVACVDYSSAKPNGRQIAYRTVPGETTLRAENYFWVPSP